MTEESKIKIRDLRSKEKFFIDDVFYDDGYMGELTSTPSSVYTALCRYADRKQECFPSIRKIAKKLKLSGRQVIRALKRLGTLGLIKTVKRQGKVNVYILLDKKQWEKLKTSDMGVTSDTHVIRPVTCMSLPPVTPMSHKGNTLEGYTLKDRKPHSKKTPKEDLECLLEKRLGRIATKNDIRRTLKEIPQRFWWVIKNFLKARYKDGEKAFYEAERGLLREGDRACL